MTTPDRTHHRRINLNHLALAMALGAAFVAARASADTTVATGSTLTITDPTDFNANAGAVTIFNGASLQFRPNSQGNYPLGNNLILAGSGGSISLGFKANDTDYTWNGTLTSTATGAQTLAIATGLGANGDRESVTFNSPIPDVADASPLGLNVNFSTQSGSQSWVNLNAVNTFTGPIALVKGANLQQGYVTIGGTLTHFNGNTSGAGTLGGGNYAGAISLDSNTILNYASSADQLLAGTISGAGALSKTSGAGTLTLSGPNTYGGNTTVGSGTLALATGGGLTFVVTNGSSNKITGAGSATLDGSFTIDTSAVTAPIASWTLVDVTTKTYGSNFNVVGFSGAAHVWTKVDGAATWTFSEASGVLSINTVATMTAFGIPGYAGTINASAMTVQLFVPYGTNLATLAPTFSITTGTCDQTSGAPPAPTFAATNPVTYTVTDGVSHPYVVTVTVLPPGPAGVNGPVLWIDASQIAGLSNGNSVDTWTDLSGYGHTASKTAGTMTYATGQVNGLPTVLFRASAYANLLGTLFAKEQYIVFRIQGGDWGTVLGSQSQSGYLLNPAGYFWNGMYPAGVSQNGSVVTAQPYQLSNIANFMILKITGNSIDPSVRSGWALGFQGAGSWHALNMDLAELVAYDHPLSAAEEQAVGSYLTAKYNVVDSTYPVGPQKNIVSFTFPSYGDATIAGTAITKYVPNGTVVTALAPTFTLSANATCDQVSGSTHDFSSPVTYTVTASDSTTKVYTVTVTVLPPGPPVAGYTRWFDASALGLADNAAVTQWIDSSGNGATATVPGGNAAPTYVANAGTESGLGAIYFAGNSNANNSAALGFTRDSSIRAVFAVFKGNSFLLTDASQYHFHRPTDNDATSPLWAGYASGNITGGSTYVNGTLVNGTSFNMPTTLHNGFNLVEVLTTGSVQADSFNKDRTFHSGNQYQAEVILYDRVLSDAERQQVEAYLTSKWFAAATSGYATWAATYAGGQSADKDYNHDGVQNGIAYFMGATGLATNPSVVNGKVAWPHSASATGITYQVLSSPNLTTWTDVTADAVDAGGVLTYTLPKSNPAGFVRLKVLAP